METTKMSPAREIYENMYEILCRRFHDYNKAWDYLIEFLAVDNCPALLSQLKHKFEWLFEDKDLADMLMSIYKPEVLKADMHDHLGDMYVKNQGKLGQSFKGQFLTPDEVVDFMCKAVIGEANKANRPLNILDPCVGTGRFLLYAHRYAPDANLFGVDIDLRALRVAFTNCAIHNIRAYLLHADSLRHEIDISKPDGIANWQYANKWYSCWDKLKEITPKRKEEVIKKYNKVFAQMSLF
jgi:type I restriction-modification system DNA methylase subunit